MEAIMYFKVVYETLTPLCVATSWYSPLHNWNTRKKNTKNDKKSTLCFFVYLKILVAHCRYNFHNFMKARNQMDFAFDATHKLI
jgi:hypothetical protein